MKWSMIRAKGPFAFTAIVYTILVPFPAGVSSVAPIMAMFSASARKRPRRKGICSNVSVNTLIVCESGPIFTVKVHRACVASRTSTFSTPGTHRPTCCMSLRKDHTFSTGAFTSNATVPSVLAGLNSHQQRTMHAMCAKHQRISFLLANISTENEDTRQLDWQAEWLTDKGHPAPLQPSHAKRYPAATAMKDTTDAVQVFGGYG